MRRKSRALCARHGVDETAIARELCMSWDELKPFVDDPLVTIGAHTITLLQSGACRPKRSPPRNGDQPRAHRGRAARPMLHLAYPYGDRLAAGPREFALARRCRIQDRGDDAAGHDLPENADHLTALPRVSLNGNYQDERLLSVLTSGAATAVWNGFRRSTQRSQSSLPNAVRMRRGPSRGYPRQPPTVRG